MASLVAASQSTLFLFLLLGVALITSSGASTANISVTNLCRFPVWSAAAPGRLNPDQSWHFIVATHTCGRTILARTRCDFFGGGVDKATCKTGDCASALCCVLSGDPPRTPAEFAIRFNVAMNFMCRACDVLRCREPRCTDASCSTDEPKFHTCKANNVFFFP